MENNLDALLTRIESQQSDFSFEKDKIEKEISDKSTVFSYIGIKLLSIIGGILGSAFFFGFLGFEIMNSASASIAFGSLFIIIAVAVHKISESILLDTSIICLYIAGLILLGLGLEKALIGENGVAFSALLISTTVLFFSRGFMMSFLSAFIANGSLLTFIFINDVPNLLHLYTVYVILAFTLLTHAEPKIISAALKLNRIYNPLRSSFLISFIVTLIIFSERDILRNAMQYNWISSTLFISAILLVINYILNSFKVQKTGIRLGYYLISILILLPEIFAPAILGSLFIILISFHYGHRTGFFTGIIALIYFISRYYYDLNLSLLVKSEILFVSGLFFITTFLALKKYLLKDENQESDYTA